VSVVVCSAAKMAAPNGAFDPFGDGIGSSSFAIQPSAAAGNSGFDPFNEVSYTCVDRMLVRSNPNLTYRIAFLQISCAAPETLNYKCSQLAKLAYL